jgi:hypothetical protein
MMRTPDVGNLHDPAASKGGLDRPHVRRILVEREMRARPVIIREVRDQRASQMPLAENDDMVQTLAPDRTDQALRERILPGASRSREHLSDAHPLHALAEGVPVDGVLIAQEIGWRGVVGESVHDLLSGPRSGRMRGDVEVQDSAPMVSEDDQDKEHLQQRWGR